MTQDQQYIGELEFALQRICRLRRLPSDQDNDDLLGVAITIAHEALVGGPVADASFDVALWQAEYGLGRMGDSAYNQ